MSKQLTIHNCNGSQEGQIDLEEKVFGVEPNVHLMHLAVRRQLNNARSGNACAKTRAQVRGGGKKPWKPLPIDCPVTSTFATLSKIAKLILSPTLKLLASSTRNSFK